MSPASPVPHQTSAEHSRSANSVEKKRPSIGPTLGIGVILFALAFGALYFWGGYLNDQETREQVVAAE